MIFFLPSFVLTLVSILLISNTLFFSWWNTLLTPVPTPITADVSIRTPLNKRQGRWFENVKLNLHTTVIYSLFEIFQPTHCSMNLHESALIAFYILVCSNLRTFNLKIQDNPMLKRHVATGLKCFCFPPQKKVLVVFVVCKEVLTIII